MILEGSVLLDVLTALNDASIYDFLGSLLASPALTSHLSVQKLKSDLPAILQMLGSHPAMGTSLTDASHNFMVQKYTNEALSLVSKKNGWHFSAQHTSAEHLEAYSLKDMAWELMAQAPLLWDLLGTLLNADPCHEQHHTQVHVTIYFFLTIPLPCLCPFTYLHIPFTLLTVLSYSIPFMPHLLFPHLRSTSTPHTHMYSTNGRTSYSLYYARTTPD